MQADSSKIGSQLPPLTAEERRLLQYFRKLSPKQQKALIDVFEE